MDTKVSNQSVPVEQVSNAEDVHNVATTMQPEEVAATINAEEPEVADGVDFSDEEARLAAERAAAEKAAAEKKLAVKKDGGDVDAITASTITSRAYADGLALAAQVFQTIGQTPMLLDVIPSDAEGTK